METVPPLPINKNRNFKNNSGRLLRYRRKLAELPSSGGNGCHQALLGIANTAAWAAVDQSQAFLDLRSEVDRKGGDRKVPDKEIQDAINKAYSEIGSYRSTYKANPRFNGRAILSSLTSSKVEEKTIVAKSPIDIPTDPRKHFRLLLDTLYAPEDILFVSGNRNPGSLGFNIKAAQHWKRPLGPYIIVNPLLGRKVTNKSGKLSYRCDAAVKTYRYCLVEFDNLSREEQFSFWATSKLPVCALIDTGGKSIHGWVKVSVNSASEWNAKIRQKLYARHLKPLGADSACQNESRLSRCPGYSRDTGRYQRLLWLSREGREVIA